MKTLTVERLKELVRYEPDTGRFIVIGKMRGKRRGQIAGSVLPDGYRRISIDGRSYGTNRLAWLYMTGSFPIGLVDHRDNNPRNDRWLNLREANHFQNMANRRRHKNTASGIKGVYAIGGRWIAVITANRKRHYLGMFATKEAAGAAYAEAAPRLHGQFARIG